MIKTSQLQEIGRLIESLGDIKSDAFVIEGGLKLFNEDESGKRELIGFIVHENNEWAYSPPVVSAPVQVQAASVQPPQMANPGTSFRQAFEDRMGQPTAEMQVASPGSSRRVSRGGQSLTDPRENLGYSSPPSGD